jgi:hypothetical protein
MQQAADPVAVLPMPEQFRRSVNGGVLPLDVSLGSVCSPKRLLDHSRRHVAGQVEHDQVLQSMTAAGIVAGRARSGRANACPAASYGPMSAPIPSRALRLAGAVSWSDPGRSGLTRADPAS